MTRAKKQDFRGFMAIIFIIFGGAVGAGALLILFLQRENYSVGSAPEIKTVLKNILLAFFLIFVANVTLLGLSENTNFNYGFYLTVPTGILIGKLILTDKNIQLLSTLFWQDVNLNLNSLESFVINSTTAQPKGPQNQMQPPQSNHYQQNHNHSPMILSQKGDNTRIILIALAFIGLVFFLLSSYWGKNQFIEQRVQEMTQQTKMAEGL